MKYIAKSEVLKRISHRDVHGIGIPNVTGNSIGLEIKHRIWNWNIPHWIPMGMGISQKLGNGGLEGMGMLKAIPAHL